MATKIEQVGESVSMISAWEIRQGEKEKRTTHGELGGPARPYQTPRPNGALIHLQTTCRRRSQPRRGKAAKMMPFGELYSKAIRVRPEGRRCSGNRRSMAEGIRKRHLSRCGRRSVYSTQLTGRRQQGGCSPRNPFGLICTRVSAEVAPLCALKM